MTETGNQRALGEGRGEGKETKQLKDYGTTGSRDNRGGHQKTELGGQ